VYTLFGKLITHAQRFENSSAQSIRRGLCVRLCTNFHIFI